MFDRLDVRRRLKASGAHLLISVGVAALAAVLVLQVWYPREYSTLAGGRELFWLLVSVDVVVGPLLTFVAFNLRKPRGELVRDLSVIAVLQLAALGYGLHTVYLARPVALVFEVDRFRVVAANDVYLEELPQARPEFGSLSLTGPRVIGARTSQGGEERLRAIDLALKGYDIGQRPAYWQPYSESRDAALARARPVGLLLERYAKDADRLRTKLAELHLAPDKARFLPVMARADGWVALLDASGELVGFAPYDGFF
ncbi:MAG: pilus assembly protein [Piscinibacter sp.]|uniref:TfpX/TfpZ family type IV pilin accessory protein n=1 Tax=Piscinibacter TaxID=1114981 RepID=UPI000FDE7237|nr:MULTISPECIES: TfpX/TfpZ family type IV pilin accessory protein [Piscinibacter]MCW5665114.1 pilus assembly protein [Piscinibacter sp.]